MQYAKGLRISNYRGLRAVSHTGGSGGYRSYLVRFPEQHFSVACLCNLANVNRRKRARAVAELYLGSLMKPTKDAFTESLPPQQLQTLAGTYRDPKTAEAWRVTARDMKLWADFEGSPLELRALSLTEFEPVEYLFEVHLKFEPGGQKGAPRKLIVNREMDLPWTLEAVEEVKPTTGELAAYAGDYWSDELRATYRLTMNGGKLWMRNLIGADGIVHLGTVPSNELRPILPDEFDLNGAPLIFHFTRDKSRNLTGFVLNGFSERGILFTPVGKAK